MQGCAQVIVAIIALAMTLWAFGFWGGLGILLLFGLIAIANGGNGDRT